MMRARREGVGVCLRDVAKDLEVSHAYLAYLEKGERKWSVPVAEKYLKSVNDHAIAPQETQ